MRKYRRNITIINNDIDYDKKTKTIDDANVQKSNEEDSESKSKEKLTFRAFFKLIYYIVKYNNSDYLQKARKYGHFTGYKN